MNCEVSGSETARRRRVANLGVCEMSTNEFENILLFELL